jgi:leucyl/phenylalanyl-tRNA--protein transferase
MDIPENDWIPDPEEPSFDGLVALGGNLRSETLLNAYREGIFPWSDTPITWWSPDPRGIIEMETFYVTSRLRRKMRQGKFSFTRDQAFADVIHACAEPSEERGETWLGDRLVAAYIEMHRLGHAHSVECWYEGALVGGIYGVACGGLFAGESMFSRISDGSKMALTYLIDHLRVRGFVLFDVQATNPHTVSLGAIEIPRIEYLQRLSEAVEMECRF